MYLPKGSLLTMRKNELDFLFLDNHREDMEWFRPPGKDDYIDSYGPFTGTFQTNRKLHLINLGSEADRRMVLNTTTLTQEQFDPNEQYNGHNANRRVHLAIMNATKLKCFDGTILDSNLIDECNREELEGAEEVVLFTKRVNNAITLVNIRQD